MVDRGNSVWRLRGLTALAASVLVVGACSGGGGSSTPSSAAQSSQPSPAASGDPSASAGAGDALADACTKGAQEGQLVHWHNHSDGFLEVVEKFNEKYPDIKVELLELSPDEAAQRVLTEVAANRKPSVDLLAGGLDTDKPLLDRGAIATDIDWKAMGVPEDVIHDSNIIRIHRIALGLGYNSDKLKAEDLPNTWEELVDAKWAGRIIVDPRGRPFDSIALAWGEEKALDYVRRLKDVAKPLVIEGGTAGLVAVAGGEADITTGGRSAETLEQQAKGAPIDIKYLDVVSTIDNYDMILKDAPHPNAARCFVGWFATEAQDLYNEVEFKTNETVPAGAPQGATVVTIDSPEQADTVKKVGKEMGKIWTTGG